MPNNTFAVNHFPGQILTLPCSDSPISCFLASVYKLDRNVRRPVYTNFKEPHFLSFFTPSAFLLSWRPEQICPQFEIKTSKESGMNEIGVEGIFIASKTHNWNVRGRAFSIRVETDICIDQCFIITSIPSSHTRSRTRHQLLPLTGRGRPSSSDNFLFVSLCM